MTYAQTLETEVSSRETEIEWLKKQIAKEMEMDKKSRFKLVDNKYSDNYSKEKELDFSKAFLF